MGGIETPAIKPRRRDDLAVVELEGEALIYDESNDNLHHLNPTATLIFNLFDGSTTIKDLATLLGEQFEISSDEAEAEIRRLTKELRMAGLLVGAGNGKP